jgi:hypothetical protein
MDKQLLYLCMVISVGWLCYFVYLFVLDAKLRDLQRRLGAREKDADQS